MSSVNVEQTLKQAFEYHQARKLVEAESLYRRILIQQPDHADALHLSGVIAHQTGRNQLAVDLIGRAIAIKRTEGLYHNNLGLALQALGQLDAAIVTYHEAIRLKPNYAEAFNNLGLALQALGQLEVAVSAYHKALEFKPDFAGAYNNLGSALEAQDQFALAIGAYRQAIELKPDLAEAYNNIGGILFKQDRFENAVETYQIALQLKPDYAEARSNLAGVLKDLGQFDAAIAEYRMALQLKPDLAHVHSNLIYSLYYHPRYDAAMILEECRQWNALHADSLKPFIRPHTNNPDLQRRLKIGYVSADFWQHASAFFLHPLLSCHNHQIFEIYCYAQIAKPDSQTERLQAYADHWRSTTGMSDENLAQQIRQDQIDILVDLKLHTANNRLLVFARKPAPVQLTWLGYPGTTGLNTIDYRLTDPYLDPPGAADEPYTEKSIHLPETFWCYDPLDDQPPVNQLPALSNGYVTFGCLNQFRKVNEGVLELWMKLLHTVLHSRLLLFVPQGQVRDRLLLQFQKAGIALTRVEFLDRQSRREYLNLYHRIDLSLDTFPCNGHTTGFDSLWMGVPFVTLVGTNAMGRAGWSQLCNLDLRELAADSPQKYVAIAAELAHNLPRLAKLRAALRDRMRQSPLMDAARFTRNVESVYRDIWKKWCAIS
jgi:protein O-GlcNAc transferase